MKEGKIAITVMVPTSFYYRLDDCRKKEGISISEMCRQSLNEFMLDAEKRRPEQKEERS